MRMAMYNNILKCTRNIIATNKKFTLLLTEVKHVFVCSCRKSDFLQDWTLCLSRDWIETVNWEIYITRSLISSFPRLLEQSNQHMFGICMTTITRCEFCYVFICFILLSFPAFVTKTLFVCLKTWQHCSMSFNSCFSDFYPELSLPNKAQLSPVRRVNCFLYYYYFFKLASTSTCTFASSVQSNIKVAGVGSFGHYK